MTRPTHTWAIWGVLLITFCATLGLSLLARLVPSHYPLMVVVAVGALLLALSALAVSGYLGAVEAENTARAALGASTTTTQEPSHFTRVNVC